MPSPASWGYRIKLLAIAREVNGKLDIRVHPAMLPEGHPLARVGGVFNAVNVVGEYVGPQVFIGHGAGSAATASAVVADIIEAARWLRGGKESGIPTAAFLSGGRMKKEILGRKGTRTCYYLRFAALDRPGVLSRISGVFGEHEISIESVIQKGRAGQGDFVPLVLMTYEASEENMQNALAEIKELDIVGEEVSLIRVESDPMAFG